MHNISIRFITEKGIVRLYNVVGAVDIPNDQAITTAKVILVKLAPEVLK